ncbi:hypothetical protein H0H93_015876 [Arthromyces matolae]|nr:hypothetical protein H0H93_015876 [Arthromyces matolae]
MIATVFLAMIASPLTGSVLGTPAPEVVPAKWLSVEHNVIEGSSIVSMSNRGANSVVHSPANATLTKRAGPEVVTCYGTGTKADRAPIVSVIDDWCNNHAIGTFVPNGQTISARYDYGTFTVLVSGAAINGCGGFTVDSNCNRLLRLPVDKCNTGGENGKQGGYETDLCGQWRTDPGSNGSDF